MKTNETIVKLRLTFILLITFTVSACLSANRNTPTGNANSDQTNADSGASETSFSVPPATGVNLAAPLEISDQPNDIARCAQINETIERSEFANARWGFLAVSLTDGRAVCGRDARKLFNPASVQKVLTSIVALDALGADFRWQTKAFGSGAIENGVLNGDLILYGTGAPDFGDEGLARIADQLSAKGLQRITGGIVGDASFFTVEAVGDGWTWNDLQWYYGAEASALSFNQNQTTIQFVNGAPAAANEFVKVTNGIKSDESVKAVGLQKSLGGNEFYAWGNGDDLYGRVAVSDPARIAAENLKKALTAKGIQIDGAARSADWKSVDKLNPAHAFELAAIDSRPLGEIVKRMNKRSLNLDAELLLRTVGRRFGDTAPDPNSQKQRLRGDDAAGASVVKKWLTERRVLTDEIQIHDGSGLSRLNFVTPEAVARALVYAAQSKFADVFTDSLPVAGTDGTLSGRLGAARGKIAAKTGSITYVNALAGYAQTPADEILAFVILCNNQTRGSDSSHAIDRAAKILTEDLKDSAVNDANSANKNAKK